MEKPQQLDLSNPNIQTDDYSETEYFTCKTPNGSTVRVSGENEALESIASSSNVCAVVANEASVSRYTSVSYEQAILFPLAGVITARLAMTLVRKRSQRRANPTDH